MSQSSAIATLQRELESPEGTQEGKNTCHLAAIRLQPLPMVSPEETQDVGFPGGAVVKNPPANAGDTGASPGLGRSHMPRSN